jgi:hypothetical protein
MGFWEKIWPLGREVFWIVFIVTRVLMSAGIGQKNYFMGEIVMAAYLVFMGGLIVIEHHCERELRWRWTIARIIATLTVNLPWLIWIVLGFSKA